MTTQYWEDLWTRFAAQVGDPPSLTADIRLPADHPPLSGEDIGWWSLAFGDEDVRREDFLMRVLADIPPLPNLLFLPMVRACVQWSSERLARKALARWGVRRVANYLLDTVERDPNEESRDSAHMCLYWCQAPLCFARGTTEFTVENATMQSRAIHEAMSDLWDRYRELRIEIQRIVSIGGDGWPAFSHLSNGKRIQIGRRLAFMLRHGLDICGLTPSLDGWVSISDVIRVSESRGLLSWIDVAAAAKYDTKGRFELSDDLQNIRLARLRHHR